MKKMVKKVYNAAWKIGATLRKDQVAAFSAQSAFFMLLSFLPLLLVICIAIRYLPITREELISVINDVLPQVISVTITEMVDEFYASSLGIAAIVSGVVAIWSAARGTTAIGRGLNFMDGTEDDKGYFRRRGQNALYTLIFSLMLLLMMGVYVLGNSIILKIINRTNAEQYADIILFIARLVTGPVIVFGVMILVLYGLPDKKHKFLSCIPGAVFSAVGMVLLSIAFSIYIDNFSGYSYMYGSLTDMMITMLWLYFSMYILFLGAEINKIVRYGFVKWVKELFADEKE